MNHHHHFSSTRGVLVLASALLLLALAAAGCAAPAPGVLATPAPAAATAAPATSAPVATQTKPAVAAGEIPVGVDAEGNFYRGDLNAPVTLVEFSEFECPYCARHVLETEPLLRDTYIATGQVLHVFRHFPLDFHAHSMSAARAAYCAGQQAPELFWELHDWLFQNQNSWSVTEDAASQFRGQALTLGADAAKYDACVADAATTARIESDLQEGAARGVQGTPAFFINDWFLSGAYPFAEFQDRIQKAQQGLKPPPTPTPLPEGKEFFTANADRPGFSYDGSPSLGEAEAVLVLVSFEDFKSPESAQHALTIEPALKTKYVDTGEMRLVVKSFANTAPKAAVATLCAASQGKFWEFRALLYEKQAEWQEGDDAAMAGYAVSLGLDREAFDLCLQDEAVRAEIDNSLQFGQQQIGVPATPSFLVLKIGPTGMAEDGQGLAGAQTLEQIEQAINALLAPQTSLPEPGAISADKLASLQVGVDADGHFYRGDPNAAVKLIEYSDFQ